MIKHKIYRITLLFMIVACTALGLTGCMFNGNVVGLSEYYYDDSENYTAGEAELVETVETIDINWMVGNVTVLPHNLDTLCFSEKSEKELTEDMTLRYWLDDTTLRIKFCAVGKWNLSDLEKDLTVLVPDTMIFSNLKVSTLSANVNLSDCAVSQSVKVNTISGKLEAKFLEPLKEFKGDSTSGSFVINSTSVLRFDIGTVSGAVSLITQKEPDWLDVDTVSGNINLVLPESASFALEYDTTSGNLSSELSYQRSAEKYIFGDGNGEYKIVTVSGNAQIKANV